MSDETSLAFELPHVRAAATSGGQPLDRISVRDYVRDVEIGAFQSERGVNQRIRFNVVLEVAAHVAAQDDDVDKVISYDTITNAIEAELAAERIKLLETLAERVAERVLTDRRAVRIFVRIEKLDRIPGALGVEIVRARADAQTPVLRAIGPATAPKAAVCPQVICVTPNADRAAVLAELSGPVVLVVDAGPVELTGLSDVAARNVHLLAMEQAAWRFASGLDGATVVDSRTEMDWALKQGLICVWAPSKIVLDAVDPPRSLDLVSLTAWFAAQVGAA